MQVVVVCPTCQAKLKFEDNLLGKTIRCPVCSQAVRAQAAAPPPPAPVQRPVEVLEEIQTQPIADVLPAEEKIDDLEPVDDLEVVDGDERGGKRRRRKRRRRRGGEDQATVAMLLHFSAIFTGMLAPLIIWLTKKNESRFIDFHGRQCLNFQVSIGLLGGMILGLLVCLGIASTASVAAHDHAAAVGGGLWITLVVWGLAGLFGLYMSIMQAMAALNAKDGEWYELPCLFSPFGDIDDQTGLR
jgi:uncharacterized Tic20 family protein